MKNNLMNTASKALVIFLLFNDNTQAITHGHTGIFDRMEAKLSEPSLIEAQMTK